MKEHSSLKKTGVFSVCLKIMGNKVSDCDLLTSAKAQNHL